MFELRHDQGKCDSCGECETVIPKLLGKFVRGTILISGENMKTHKEAVDMAVSICKTSALSLAEPGA